MVLLQCIGGIVQTHHRHQIVQNNGSGFREHWRVVAGNHDEYPSIHVVHERRDGFDEVALVQNLAIFPHRDLHYAFHVNLLALVHTPEDI